MRAGLYMACNSYIQGNDVTQLASMLKLKAGRLCRIIPDQCLQFWGGMILFTQIDDIIYSDCGFTEKKSIHYIFLVRNR